MANKVWVVVDPRPTSTLADLVLETTAAGFGRACVGGPIIEEHPEIHSSRYEALRDAFLRCRDLEKRFGDTAEDVERARDAEKTAAQVARRYRRHF